MKQNPPLSPIARRESKGSPTHFCLTDRLAEGECRFLRFQAPGSHTFPGVAAVHSCPAGGWLLGGEDTCFWLPRLPVARRLDGDGHILEEKPAPVADIGLDAEGLTITLAPETGWVADLVVWRLTPGLRWELTELAPVETQSWFLWGSHTAYSRPADLYLHLIHGWVYENRANWPKYWKICSENDAHALYVLFSGLFRATGKGIYQLFKQQLIRSVLARQADDGGWYHGEWTDRMESHFRLHTSALHLLQDAWEECGDAEVAEALRRGAEFLLARADHLDEGIWFLHDSLELSEASMRESPFVWLPSHAFGKSVSNMLVLNSHWDTTVAIDRAAALSGDAWREAVAAANRATAQVLVARPAEALYRLAFGLIALSFLPTERAAALPLWRRALKRVGWKYLIPRFHHLKRRFPRLVMPGGYLDRALSLKGISTAYQAINVMDLVRLHARFPELNLRPVIDAAIDFTHRSGLWERWGEDRRTRYAYGFWAEALHRLALLDDDMGVRRRLAATLMRMAALNLGLPPGLLGGDRERGQPPGSALLRVPAPLRIVDLSREGRPEYLVLNPGREAVAWAPDTTGLRWFDGEGRPVAASVLQPGRWWLGR